MQPPVLPPLVAAAATITYISRACMHTTTHRLDEHFRPVADARLMMVMAVVQVWCLYVIVGAALLLQIMTDGVERLDAVLPEESREAPP